MANAGQSGLFYLHNAGEISLKAFPQDLRRSLISRLDPRFAIIFGSLFLVAFISVSILSSVKISDTVSEKEITKIQERYAQLVLNQPKPKPPEVKAEDKSKANETGKVAEKGAVKEEVKVDREKETFVQRKERAEATKEQRQAVRQRVAAAVQTAGIFAAITASGGGPGSGPSTGGSVTDLLGATGECVGDLGNIKVSKGTFATRSNVDVGELKARRGTVTQGVDIARESVGRTRSEHISSGGGVAISSAVPEVTGNTTNAEARSQASIKKVIDLESNRLKRVYETWLKRDPTLAGQLKIKFTIMPDGSVTNVTVVSSSTKNTEFDETLMRYIKRWAFPAMDGGSPVEVVYPFVFEAQT
jgi:TonB family protein